MSQMASADTSASAITHATPRHASIWTSRYANPVLAERPDLCKVGITLGRPKYPLRYPYIYLPLLAPERDIFRISDQDAFELAFVQQLKHIGLATIINALRQISEQEGGRDLVLLCFEDLRKPGEWCHRRMVASWLERQCGLVIEELPDPSTPPWMRQQRLRCAEQRHTSELPSKPHWNLVVTWDEARGFVASAPDVPEALPGVGETPAEAERRAEERIGSWIEDCVLMEAPLPVVPAAPAACQQELWSACWLV